LNLAPNVYGVRLNGPSISRDDWILVPRWDEFQHYRDRNPLWIKVYAKLLHNPQWLDLSCASRALLLVIWLLYSQESGQVQVKMAQRYGGKGVGVQQLKALNHAGFIEFSASKPLAQEKEREKETPKPPLTDEAAASELLRRAFEFAAEYQGSSEAWDQELDSLERQLHARLTVSQRAQLWDLTWKRLRSG
jgi:hypothetical protein